MTNITFARIKRKIARALRLQRNYEARDPEPIGKILAETKGTVAFDIGANVGHVSDKLALHFGRVFAFEPAYESFEQLKRKSRSGSRIESFNLAISDKDGFVALDVREEHIRKGQLVNPDTDVFFDWGQSQGKRIVPSLTLDTLIDTLPKPDFIKIDTEGHEAKIIRAGLQGIKKCLPNLLIEIHGDKNGQEIKSELEASHKLEIIRHPGHSEGSENWKNHYFILATPHCSGHSAQEKRKGPQK